MSSNATPEDPRASGRYARFSGAAVGILCTIGLVLVVSALWVLPAEIRMRDLALALEANGVAASVTGVRSDGDVTFRADGGERFTATVASSGEPPALERGTRVIYLPEDPSRVMAASDLPYYINDAVPGGTYVLLLGSVPCVTTAVAWATTRRHPWWKNVLRFVPNPP